METKARILREIRGRAPAQVIDLSGAAPGEVAIYTLSDPREARLVRYVGQTRNPRRRLLQHVSAARVWLPDELPWWLQGDPCAPLHAWLRELFKDGSRLPLMIVVEWTDSRRARPLERAHICRHLGEQTPLLNHERLSSQRQPVLL